MDELAIYIQGLRRSRKENDFSKLEDVPVSKREYITTSSWFMIRTDSDLHRHTCRDTDNIAPFALRFPVKKNGNTCKAKKSKKHCDVHRMIRGFPRDDLPCADMKSPVLNTPDNALGDGGSLAIAGAGAVTIYMIGGYDRVEQFSHGSSHIIRFLTGDVYMKENVIVGAGAKDQDQSPWKPGPSLIRTRTRTRPVFLEEERKIYVFGASNSKFMEGDPMVSFRIWSPWAEVLDLNEEEPIWKPLPSLNQDVFGYQDIVGAHDIRVDQNGNTLILLYLQQTGDIVSFDTTVNGGGGGGVNPYSMYAKGIGIFEAAAFSDGIFYGSMRYDVEDEADVYTIYYYDLKNPTAKARRLTHFRHTPGYIIPNGLIPAGRDTLYVVRAVTQRGLHGVWFTRVYILKYGLKRSTTSSTTHIEAALVSKASYVFNDVAVIEDCLAIPL